ncbi:MAG TPA: hypothetical protein VFB62_18970 [Polyangiaceae bacterium]|jgi:hypothetical protein|nr:hypothetical protein [Polyangiaceae bacterium]
MLRNAVLLIILLVLQARDAFADYPFCNADGACAWPETCGTCPMECGSCDVTARTNQRAKYVDRACAEHGDGLADSCAAGPGQPGRFNDLQLAIESLVAGDTLYIHPGDYFQPAAAFGPGDNGVHGEPDAPIIITASDRANPPTIHSWNPSAPDNASSHTALAIPGEDVIIDHLRIDGVAIVWGTRVQLQYIECTHGWEVCDGNWSCLRAEWCTDCRIHHNYVHDVVDVTNKCNGEWEPREAGLKEFDGERNIWEFNTIESAARWGYDLHRNSLDTIVRFNQFQGFGSWAINIERATNNQIYGNLIVGAAGCMDVGGLNEQQQVPHHDLIHHNTCFSAGTGFHVGGEIQTELYDNITAALASGGSESVNVALPGASQSSDCNAWDASSWFSSLLYEAYYHSLAEWQVATGLDAASIAAPGGACTFVDAPASVDDAEFDLHVASGDCATLGCDGREVGPFGITNCVGHDCGEGGIQPGTGGGTSSGTAGAGGGSTTSSGAGGMAGNDPEGDSGCTASCAVARGDRWGALTLLLGLFLLRLCARDAHGGARRARVSRWSLRR